MSAILHLYEKQSAPAEQSRTVPQAPVTPSAAVSRLTDLQRDQIQSLVQQLFFQHESAPVRHIGVTAAEDSAEIAHLCFDVAQVLAEEGTHDIGLIDASPASLPLETQLGIAPATTTDPAWPVAPHLWFVPRQNWMPDRTSRQITEHNTSRLRELAAEFDFSILCCPSVSWVTARIGRVCDGLVLVLTANKTRRLVACQMRDQLRMAQIPLLGTVLTERRFPIPRGLYRSL